MKFWTASKRLRNVGVPAVLLMLLLWLAAFALASSPQLHRLLHADSKNPNHHCLVTQLQHHPLLVGLVPVVSPVVAPSGLAAICQPDFQVLPANDRRLAPSRGPPSVISSIPVVG